MCWGGNADQTDKNRIDGIIHSASKVIGEDLDAVDTVYFDLVEQKLDRVMEDTEHPLHDQLTGQQSLMGSGRVRLPRLLTNRHRDSFIPRAITMHNKRLNS